jgi:hypothetical protein
MIDFEDQLRAALSRKEPSADFLRNVVNRAEHLEQDRRAWWRPWAAGCIAASLLVGSIGMLDWQQRRERQRGEIAGAQLVRALEITSSRLQKIHKKVEGVN